MSSTLFISEFSDLPFTTNGALRSPGAQYWVADQTVTVSVSSAASAAFNAATTYVLLVSDVSCSIAWTQVGAGSTTAATTGNFLLPANTPMMFGVAGGMKVSAITNS